MDKFVIDEWIVYSNTDLSSAKHLYDTMNPQPLEIICYLCQQSSEKILKAYWLYCEFRPPRTHDLEVLRAKCGEIDKAFVELINECARLNSYSIQPRYPFGMELTKDIALLAIKDSESISNFVKARIVFESEGGNCNGKSRK